MKILNRRDFFQKTFTLLGSTVLLNSCQLRLDEGPKILIPSQYGGKKDIRFPNIFYIFDIEKEVFDSIIIPLAYSHSATILPQKNLCLIIEKDGPHGCIIDLKSKKVKFSFKATKDHVFSGHVLLNPNDGTLITSEFDYKKSNQIVFRDSRTMKPFERMDSPGLRPHEMKWLSNQHNNFALGHYGTIPTKEVTDREAEVSIINYKKKIVTKRYKLPNKSYMPCHLDVYNGNKIIIGTLDLLSNSDKVSKRLVERLKDYEKSKHYPLNEEKFFKLFKLLPSALYEIDYQKDQITDLSKGQKDKTFKWNLTVEVDSTRGVLAVTHVYSDAVSFWDIRKKKIIKVIPIKGPTGIVSYSDKWVVYGGNSTITYIENKTFTITKKVISPQFIGAASHIVTT